MSSFKVCCRSIVDELPSRSPVGGGEEDIAALYEMLRDSANCRGRGEMLVADFRRMELPGKPRFFPGSVGVALREHDWRLPLILAGIPRGGLEQMPFQSSLSQRGSLLIVSDYAGRTHWLGLRDSALIPALDHIYSVGRLQKSHIRLLLPRVAQRKELDELLQRNSHYFEYDDKSGVWTARVRRSAVEEALDERYESWLLGELARLEVRREGHFRLPSGLHTDTYFQSEMLLRYPDILTRLAEEMFRRVFTCSPTTLLSYSLLGLQLAAQLADLFAREGYDVRQSPASGYPDPLPRLADTVHERDRIAIITDVVSSGNAVGALREFARAKAATVVAAICVVDTNSIGERLPLEPLAKCEALSFQTAQECELCQKGTAYQEIDPYTSAVLPTMPARQTAPTALDSTAFWTMAHKCAAVRRGHFSSNGHHFSLFVETARILRDESNIRMITDLARATPDYDDVKAVVHPVHESAMILGREIGSSLEAIAIPAHRRPDAHEYIIAPDYAEDLRARAPGKVLLVDDGANFGSTLLGMHYAVTRFLEYHKIEGYSLAACVLLDRLNGFYAELVREKFGSRFRALYSLKSPPVYHHADCPICRRNDFLAVRMRTAAKEIREQYEEELKANAVVFLDVGLREAADRGLSR